MPLTHDDWREIQSFVNRAITQRGEPFVQGVVVKSDPVKMLVWLKEFGDQPIPVVAFDYEVKYFYNETYGNTQAVGAPVQTRLKSRKTNTAAKEVKVLCPKKGDVVLVARHLGSRRLPKCLGVIKSKGYVTNSEGGGL